MSENIAAIIQARMSSTRLPGKVLTDICGKSMLWHVVDRLKYSKLIKRILIATTTSKEDDIIEDFCRKYGLDFYRGDKLDVLDRYYKAAKTNKVDIVVRITSDCPLIDPYISDRVIAAYLNNRNSFDGACNVLKRRYPRGLDTEVFPFSVIEKAWEGARKDYQREHVTPYIYDNKDLFKVFSVENSKDLSSLRWTVDESPDLEFVREIYNILYKENNIFITEDLLKLLEAKPFLNDINKLVKQKAV